MTIDPVLGWTFRLALALLLGVAAWHKLSSPRRFEGVLRSYELVPSWTGPIVARLLPVAEVGVAVGLLYPETQRLSAGAAVAMLTTYTAAIATNLARGRRHIDCGCFAASARTPLSGRLVARNFVLIGAAAAVLLPIRSRTLLWIDAYTVGAALIALALMWAAGRRLAHTGPAIRGLGGSQ